MKNDIWESRPPQMCFEDWCEEFCDIIHDKIEKSLTQEQLKALYSLYCKNSEDDYLP